MKRFLSIAITFLILLSLCIGCTAPAPVLYSATFYDAFDTVTVLKGYAQSKAEFNAIADTVHASLLNYHNLFDIYHDVDGINNLKTINDHAGSEPVKVDREIIDLLVFCKEVDSFTDHKVDAMLGSVLSLWHEARSTALSDPSKTYLPSNGELEDAFRHTGFYLLEIDESASTVFITDSDAKLDVGAIAKGYAAQKIIEQLPDGYLLSLGGNIAVKGTKPDGAVWNVGIQDPDDSASLVHVLTVTDVSVVTSGDYQRSFSFEGNNYHHIIDPETLYPATLWKSVSVVCSDSLSGDALSTALFLMSREDGILLLEQFEAEAMWIAADGTMFYTDGFLSLIKQ